MTLLRQQLKAEAAALLIWSLSLGALIFYSMTLWKSLMSTDAMGEVLKMLETMPPAMRAMLGSGGSLLTINGWVSAYAYGHWILIPLMVYTGLLATSIISREMDRRTMEFLLSLPTSRWEVLIARWGGMALSLGILQAVHLLMTAVGVAAIGETPDVGGYLLAELNLWLLLLAMGTLFLLISVFVDDYGRAVGITLGTGFAFYFAQIGLEGHTGTTGTVRRLLPFAQFQPGEAISGTAPLSALLYLTVLTLVSLGLSLYFFQRKQIAV